MYIHLITLLHTTLRPHPHRFRFADEREEEKEMTLEEMEGMLEEDEAHGGGSARGAEDEVVWEDVTELYECITVQFDI